MEMFHKKGSQPSADALLFSDLSRYLTRYMFPLDGLRGIAILLVIAHNLGVPGDPVIDGFAVKLARMFVNAGWFGVQLFFVLSGFLITGFLLQENAPGIRPLSSSLRDFYIRRILRIFPLYYSTLFAALVFFPFFGGHAKSLEGPLEYQRWYWAFVSNWGYAWHDLGGSFAHFWSLAVEEQFYVVWPLLVLNLRLKNLKWLCVFIVIMATLFRIFFTLHDPVLAVKGAYTFSVARFDALAIGGLLAIILRDPIAFSRLKPLIIPMLSCGCAYVIGVSVICHNFGPVVPVVKSSDYLCLLNQTVAMLISVAAIFLSIVPVASSGAVKYWRFFLQLSAMQTVGKYSFAMYVFHMPLINFWLWISEPWINLGSLGPLLLALVNMISVTTLSLLLAMVSWRVLEQPCLKLKSKIAPRRQVLKSGSTSSPLDLEGRFV